MQPIGWMNEWMNERIKFLITLWASGTYFVLLISVISVNPASDSTHCWRLFCNSCVLRRLFFLTACSHTWRFISSLSSCWLWEFLSRLLCWEFSRCSVFHSFVLNPFPHLCKNVLGFCNFWILVRRPPKTIKPTGVCDGWCREGSSKKSSPSPTIPMKEKLWLIG